MLSVIRNHLLTAVVVAAGLTACSWFEKPAPEDPADRDLAARVSSALNADKQLYAQHIAVRASSGVVSLSGFVWDNSDLHEAERVAGTVQGVAKVVNNIELERNSNDNNGISR